MSADSAIARGHQHAAGAGEGGNCRRSPGPRRRLDKTCADRAYGSRANRPYLRHRGIGCTLREKRDQIATHRKRHRAVATRYDKLAVRYEATVPEALIIATGQQGAALCPPHAPGVGRVQGRRPSGGRSG
ncbi:hypothetical protein San01_09260 [Streptomyces angustmyceticus]|uniref:Transposase DDE domain-containing protein n=1 Tax=Streptomyces angustmyceticus TaxID=285578 RepID=A0A5J4LA86_9ACTN|nr:hypothetical protein San01_09260 [Streptomyces angustmyceticus]